MQFRSIIHEPEMSTEVLSSLPDWCGTAVQDFRSAINDLAFPCFYASGSNLYYSFLDSFIEQPEVVGEHFKEYIDVLETFPPEEAGLSARTLLITFEKPRVPQSEIAEYERNTWDLLQRLLDTDTHAWPSHLPLDPDTPTWEFSYGGVPMFVNVGTPAHVHRKSRNLGSSLVLVTQARQGIDFCAPPTLEGDRTREAIRKRLDEYDTTVRAPDLNIYGNETNREWKLYFLSDDGQPRSGACPIRRGLRVSPPENSR